MSISFLLAIPLLGYLATLGFFYIFQEQVVFFPRPDTNSPPSEWGMAAEELFLQSDGHVVNGWYMPGQAGQPVVHFSHGNASTIGHLRDYALLFHRMGMGVLLYDYRGYGKSQGKPDEEGAYVDGEAAWHHLTTTLGIDPRRVVLFGHSLGGGVASWLESRHPCLALVVEGTFSSVTDLGKEVYPFLPRWVGRIHFDNLSRMANAKVPVLIIHARQDEMIPVSHAHRLYAVTPQPKQLLEIDGTHNRGFVQGGGAAHGVFQQFIQTAWQAVNKE